MNFKTRINRYVPESARRYLRRRLKPDDIAEFSFDRAKDVAADIKNKYGYSGDMLDLFVANRGNLVHKWHHYIPLYDRYFSPYRGRQVRFLEIGVSKGGSLQLWRKYFGNDAIICGIDVNPECAKLDGNSAMVRIGSQADARFLNSVIEEMGGIDIVLDDGSHQMAHIRASLAALFPRLRDGGIYMIEDLHTAYWKGFGGGYHSKGNFFRFISELVDDMHNWYHRRKMLHAAISNNCSGIHIHDSIVVIDKRPVYPPVHSKIN